MGRIEVNIAALNAAISSDDDTGYTSTSVLAFAGLTARMDVLNDGNTLQVSNMSLGNGPLTLTIDSVEQFSMMLSTFEFIIDGDVGEVTLNKNLDFAVSIVELLSLDVSAPSDTVVKIPGRRLNTGIPRWPIHHFGGICQWPWCGVNQRRLRRMLHERISIAGATKGS